MSTSFDGLEVHRTPKISIDKTPETSGTNWNFTKAVYIRMAGKKTPKKNQSRSHQKNAKLSSSERRAVLVRATRHVIENTQLKFRYDSLRCEYLVVVELAEMLVDMAEDLHCEIGLWAAYEKYNLEVFGTELPLTFCNTDVPPCALHPDRFCHFLWVMYPVLIDGLMLNPDHHDLRLMAAECSRFLSSEFSKLPKTSTRYELLQTPNDRGWDVKRKLVWLGTNSYLFRRMFKDYMAEQGVSVADIPHTDDFICMQWTQWSGMAAIDVLARVLDLSPDDFADLTSWYERHAAYYRIVSPGRAVIQALNLVSDQNYSIRMDQENQFVKGMTLFASLIPWRGEWYWSGEQNSFENPGALNLSDMKQMLIRKSSQIVCRYDLVYRVQVIQRMAAVHADSLAYFCGDLVSFPDGLAMASAFEMELQHQWNSKPQEQVKDVMLKHGLEDGRPKMNLPREITDHSDGVGVFLNPAEGKEIMIHFTSLLSALKQTDDVLTEDQERSVRGFLTSSSISPAFVQRLLTEYGDQVVRQVFILKGEVPPYWLDYFLRRYKGKYFRQRYPALSLI